MGFCEQAAGWATSLRAADVPDRVLERGRLQETNLRAAARAGEKSAAPVAAVAPEGPAGDVYHNAAASIAHDWDDYLFLGHTGHSAVWAASAFCPDDPERALLAQVAANEIAGRLGAALFLGPHNGQFWSSIHCAGGAVAAGVAIGLGSQGLAHALAIALYQPPFGNWPGFMGPGSKLLTAAEPAAQGARAALLAAEGLDGALDVVEHPRGLLAQFAFASRPEMLGSLGEVWLTDTLAYKPYPGCAYLQPAVGAALASEVAPADVASIEVEAGYLTCEMERLGAGDPLTGVRVNFSTALSLAATLIAGRLTHEELRPEWLGEHEAELRALASRVRIRHDWALTAETLRGTVDAGASLGGVSLSEWRRVGRRSRELHMDAAPGWGDLRRLLRDPRARRALGSVARSARRNPPGIEHLDTERIRLSFPCRLRIHLRSGRTLAVEGKEQGSCNSPVEEQREVVAEKARLANVEPALA